MTRMACFTSLVIGTAIATVGCAPSNEYKPAKDLPAKAHDEHGHDEHGAGPHQGALVELGEEEFHAELVLDDKAHTLTLYLLGPDAKTDAATSAAEVAITTEDNATLKLTAAPGSAEGKNSVFQLTDEKTVHDVAEAGFIHGTLSVTVGEKSYTAMVDVHFHGEHDHDHEKPAVAP